MAGISQTRNVAELKRCDPTTSAEESDLAVEIAQLRRELDIIKNANPFRMAEVAIELQIERLRVVEITRARDTTLQRLSESYILIRQKNDLIEQLQNELGEGVGGGVMALPVPQELHQRGGCSTPDLGEMEQLKAHICTVEAINEELRLAVAQLRAVKMLDIPPCYEKDEIKTAIDAAVQTDAEDHANDTGNVKINDEIQYIPPKTDDPQALVEARNALLASIPLPDNPPDATLNAFVISSPFTIHEFLNAAPAALRTALSNHKILHNLTTHWCPEREENGFMYCPVFKCNTNPRIATAHRWSVVDCIGCMSKPTECFYNKEGVWYYAGSYQAFRMDELSTKEWAQLPSEIISAIVKETLAGRKSISPQNTYETTQLYAAGALRVACIGLRCVGFNQEVYKSILEHSVKFSEFKWKSLTSASAKVLAAAAQASPNQAQDVGNNTPPTGHSIPTTKTPIITKHDPRTPSLASPNMGSENGSPSTRRGPISRNVHIPTSPPLGLGFGSSTWTTGLNGKVGLVSTLPFAIQPPTPLVDAHHQTKDSEGRNL